MSSTAVKVGLAVGGAYVAYKVLDSKHQITNDLRLARRLLPLKRFIKAKYADGWNFAMQWNATAKKYANKTCVLFDNQSYTFREMDQASNRIANWAAASGLKRGDRVALVMENRPEFIMCMIGFAKAGVVLAMINNNLRSRSLVHCIKVSNAKIAVFGGEVVEALAEVKDQLTALGVRPSLWGATLEGVPSIDPELASASTEPVHPSMYNTVTLFDDFGYIYTSGTTGLPKAAVIKHAKMVGFGAFFCHAFQVTSADTIYTCLPLYHSAGGGCGVGMMVYGGATIVIRRKFSASKFWREVAHYKCTVVQYIGELCRYLLGTPPSEYDAKHRVRIAIGNGLRPDIWDEFQARFNVPEIGEFYGATEGNVALINHCVDRASRGTVGRYGTIMMKALGVKIVKFDVAEEAPVRGPDGFCIPCKPGEPGEMLGLIKPDDPTTQFQGYTDAKASAKKVMTDVFVKGDKYFRTGDLLMRDSNGYFHFVDRIGDTFRWKGENVSTTEVAEALSVFPGVLECNVYGAAIPGKDGRACMAAMVLDDSVDLDGLLKHARKELPSYAVPLFIRKLPEIEITGTFKHRKVTLRKEGFNPNTITDSLLWLNPDTDKYEPLDNAAFVKITTGGARL